MPTQAALAHSLAPQVRKGKVPGIYTTWEECSKQVPAPAPSAGASGLRVSVE